METQGKNFQGLHVFSKEIIYIDNIHRHRNTDANQVIQSVKTQGKKVKLG